MNFYYNNIVKLNQTRLTIVHINNTTPNIVILRVPTTETNDRFACAPVAAD